MGRKKLEIKRIEDKSARQVTFSKRRNGLLKKAKELSVLCDLDVAVIIFSGRGKLYHYCNSSTRKKLEIKRIEDKSARQVTFSKRRNGLLKKAKELSVLCDLDVAVIIFSGRGKLYHYCNSSTSLKEIVQRYQAHIEAESKSPSSSSGASKPQKQQQQQRHSSKYSRFLTCGELLQTVEREEEFVDELNVTDLLHLEKQFETALIQTRTAKTDLLLGSITSLHEKEKMLEEEKRLLKEKIVGSKAPPVNIDLNAKPSS